VGVSIDLYKYRKHTCRDKPFILWLDRLLVMGTIGSDDWDRECGKFFGYPNCCIEWFIFMSKLNAHVGRMTDYLYGAVHCGYVKCPKCRKKDSNKSTSGVLTAFDRPITPHCIQEQYVCRAEEKENGIWNSSTS